MVKITRNTTMPKRMVLLIAGSFDFLMLCCNDIDHSKDKWYTEQKVKIERLSPRNIITRQDAMSQTVTLTLPNKLYRPIQRAAQATRQPVEKVLLTALAASLPPLDDLPADLAGELAQMESLNNDALWQAMLETVPITQQQALEKLLQKNQAGELTPAERERLASLQHAADGVMLRKAHAAVLLRFRGRRIPTLAELRRSTITAQ
ncbi:MAG: hypothetical protein U9R15_07855 [Chloroflexota bacterium]|nr:hypothetical protein [Chloroflexota bacterium]